MQENNRDFSVFKKKILIYLDFKGISKYECYQNTGITNGVLSQPNGISEDNILKFLSYYSDINPEWLLTGNGSMLKTNSTKINTHTKSLVNETIDLQDKDNNNNGIKQSFEQKNISVPLIPIEAVAGFPTEDTNGIKYEDCEQYSVPEFEKSGCEFVIRVSGSSMYPKYSNGDILACRKIRDILFFQWGKVYVIDSSQGALVKRIFEDKENPGNIVLASDNKENYPPFPIPKSDIRSLSIVLGVIRME
jgi:phage repressor protein C with HTH and peptisase S24 domain